MTFIATVAAVYVVWRNLIEAAQASAERMDADRSVDVKTEEIESQLDRFVSRGRLFRLRLTFAVIPFAVVFGILFMAGVEKKFVLVLVPLLFSLIGSFIPLLYYRIVVKRRQDRFEADILDFTSGIGNALRAGMALPQALEKIGEQIELGLCDSPAVDAPGLFARIPALCGADLLQTLVYGQKGSTEIAVDAVGIHAYIHLVFLFAFHFLWTAVHVAREVKGDQSDYRSTSVQYHLVAGVIRHSKIGIHHQGTESEDAKCEADYKEYQERQFK
jgi:hypothetical protein